MSGEAPEEREEELSSWLAAGAGLPAADAGVTPEARAWR